MYIRPVGFLILLILFISLTWAEQHHLIDSLNNKSLKAQYIGDITPPDGCIRNKVSPNNFGAWLRKLPLKPLSSPIKLYNGNHKLFQHGLYRVIDLDIGKKDLQQCADVVIRLRSDYLISQGRINDIAFNFTSGDRAKYSEWIEGKRPIINGNNVTWNNTGKIDSSYSNYQEYLKTVFMYAGSYSLSRELRKVKDANKVKAGDCYIEGGFPGHVIIVVDVAIDTISGEKFLMFAQGFTPAQDIHIIRNLRDNKLDPWYRLQDDSLLNVPEWTFEWSQIFSFD